MAPGRAPLAKCYCFLHFSDISSPWPVPGRIQPRHNVAPHRIVLQKHYHPLQPIGIEHSPGFAQKRKCLKNHCKTYNSFTLPPLTTYRIPPRHADPNTFKRCLLGRRKSAPETESDPPRDPCGIQCTSDALWAFKWCDIACSRTVCRRKLFHTSYRVFRGLLNFDEKFI